MNKENAIFETIIVYDGDEFEIEYNLEPITEGDMHKGYAHNITSLKYKGIDLIELNSICDRVAEIVEDVEINLKKYVKWE